MIRTFAPTAIVILGLSFAGTALADETASTVSPTHSKVSAALVDRFDVLEQRSEVPSVAPEPADEPADEPAPVEEEPDQKKLEYNPNIWSIFNRD